jgi:hypothetical protein
VGLALACGDEEALCLACLAPVALDLACSDLEVLFHGSCLVAPLSQDESDLKEVLPDAYSEVHHLSAGTWDRVVVMDRLGHYGLLGIASSL